MAWTADDCEKMAEALERCAPPQEREARLKMVMAAGALQTAGRTIATLRQRNEALVKALSPFIAGVHNDNGDVTVSRSATTLDDVEAAYWAAVNDRETDR